MPKESVSPCRASPGQKLASYFDHTLLKPEATREAFEKLFQEAILWKPFSVCIPPNRVRRAVDRLKGSGVKVCTVIGFPLGYTESSSKATEVRMALEDGCDEFDTVIPIGLLKDGNIPAVFKDIYAVVQAAQGRLVKVILETCLLTEEEKLLGGVLAILAGAHMLKTSTGFASKGATVEDVALLRILAGKNHGVKAAGGIRDYATARAMIEAGADRIGASATPAILSEAEGRRSEP
ncbi:MAG: deoxyribose-phosphate aldolase [Spirochaetes bacterium]|nr:deoxyribose-phosphate aldolase [Spirochaetota bacterium]